MKSKKDEGPLVAAAAALEAEVLRWEAVVAEADRTEVSSDKALQRVRGALAECAAHEATLAGQLQAFVTAMQALQARQRACMEATVALASRMQARLASRTELLDRFGALGQRAGSINEPVATVMDGLARKAAPEELLAPLELVATRSDEVAADADAIARAAREAAWDDIAREAEGLKQQIQSVRNKVLVAHRNVAARAPS
jgi:hypothetical protein